MGFAQKVRAGGAMAAALAGPAAARDLVIHAGRLIDGTG